MWIDAKKLDGELAALMPLIKVGVGLMPGTNGNLFLAFLQAITAPNVIDSCRGHRQRGVRRPTTSGDVMKKDLFACGCMVLTIIMLSVGMLRAQPGRQPEYRVIWQHTIVTPYANHAEAAKAFNVSRERARTGWSDGMTVLLEENKGSGWLATGWYRQKPTVEGK